MYCTCTCRNLFILGLDGCEVRPCARVRPCRTCTCRNLFILGLDGCEVRPCDPCARVRPCVPCESRPPRCFLCISYARCTHGCTWPGHGGVVPILMYLDVYQRDTSRYAQDTCEIHHDTSRYETDRKFIGNCSSPFLHILKKTRICSGKMKKDGTPDMRFKTNRNCR